MAVMRQEKLCRERAAALGWGVRGVYRDNSVSASSPNVVRPAYQQMLRDLEAGVIDAVVVYDLDRLTRRPVELEQFVDLADRTGVALASVDREVDLATDGGRLFARIRGAVARAEVERKGRRQRDANDQRAAAGLPSAGRRLFGYTANGLELVTGEAAIVRECFERMIGGEGLRTIARDLEARGVLSTAGNPILPTQLRRILTNPRYMGLRVHRGEVVGMGVWPAIVDEETFRSVGAVLSDRSRHRVGAPAKYLLSGLGVCADCGETVTGARQARGARKRVRLYQCRTRRHVVRGADPVEQFVREVVIARLSAPDARKAFSRSGDERLVHRLRTQEAALRSRLDGLAEAFAAGDVDRTQLRAGSSRLRVELSTLVEQLDASTRSLEIADLLGAEDIASAWDSMPFDRRRAVIQAIMTVRLASPGRGARRFDESTVQIVWKRS